MPMRGGLRVRPAHQDLRGGWTVLRRRRGQRRGFWRSLRAGGASGSGGLAGDGGSGGSGGGLGGTGGGGTGGGGTGGTGGCLSTQKLCSGACVSKLSATYGCSSTSCSPCPSGQPNATPSCLSGLCSISCTSSTWGNCDANNSNGCETPLNASGPTAHCGKCNRSCSNNHAAATTCTTGSCSPLCTDGYGNCNETSKPLPDDGCETALGNTTGHCGVCGNSCSLQGGTLSKFSCAEGKCGWQHRLPVRGLERPVGGQLQFCPSSLRLRGQYLWAGRGVYQGGAKSHLQLQRWRRLPHRFDLLRHGLQEPAH